MRKDSLGRDIPDNSIIVVFKHHFPNVEIGVMIKDKIRTRSRIEPAIISDNLYLVTNPTKEEEKIRDEIIDEYNSIVKKKKEKIREKGKPEFASLIGGVYSTDQGKFYLYLGNIEMIFYDANSNQKYKHSGNCYRKLQMPYNWQSNTFEFNQERMNEYTLEEFKQDNESSFQFLKGQKRITGLCGILNDFKNIDNICGTFDWQCYDWHTGKYEMGKKIIRKK